MTSSFRLGRVAGIDIGANWTWLLIVVLVLWSLAAAVFPETNPGLGGGTYALMAVIAAPLFFVSLLLHELGHAIQARRDGVEIDGITLWVFGGVARFRSDMPSAAAELRIAAAGPAVSLVIAASFLAFSILVPLPSAVDGVIHWLGYINLVLLAFNLIPAFPLDGGRILRALLWRRRGDMGAATRTAAAGGRAFGILLIVAGFFLAVFAGAFGGLWLALIGFFLLTAAEAELQAGQARGALEGVRVADVMVRDPVSVSVDLPVRQFVDDVFLRHRHTAYPVTRDGGRGDGRVVGLVSFRDVLALPRERWEEVLVADVMVDRERALVLDPGRDLSDAMRELAADRRSRALVPVEGEATGLLSMTDAARALEALQAERGGR